MDAEINHHVHLNFATGLCPELGKFGPQNTTYISKDNFNITLPPKTKSKSGLQIFLPRYFMHFYSLPRVLRMLYSARLDVVIVMIFNESVKGDTQLKGFLILG
jgi:hypothetical protein